MKKTIKNTLEKILNFADKQRKNVLIGVTALGIGAGVANASNGGLDIKNKIVDHGMSNELRILLYNNPSYSEGLDGFDSIIPSFIPNCSTIYTEVEGVKLLKDHRPNYVTSIETNLGHEGFLSDASNKLEFSFVSGWGNFLNDTVTFQQFDSNEPNVAYPVYDIRKEIYYGGGTTGTVNLPKLSGTYNSVEPYAQGAVYFDRNLADFNNDGIVNLLDWNVLAKDYLKGDDVNHYNSLADIAISGDPNNAIALPGTTTPYFDGKVDSADVIKFAENWLVDYRTE